MIRAGIGGWNFEGWRGGFYPKGLARARELAHASRALNTIEINATFHRDQKPASFRRWADETPDDFVFSVKASRFATTRRVLAEAGPSIERFVTSGIGELRHKLGPILWQFAPTKTFDAEDFEAFLALLPREHDGLALRHAVEVRHASFAVPEFVALARKHGAAIVVADSAKYPLLADVTADFVYARLQRSQARIATGYALRDLDTWIERAKAWTSGVETNLPLVAQKAPKRSRDVFLYMINGAKERAPAAAIAFLERLG
ncbi:MAG TPA: DUF72 domain-containing protein [Rhizomicrobium sp.]|nr:DUF72 domain-containing protein [Rhizomicrobium sp.]